jgi:hypothetical protein
MVDRDLREAVPKIGHPRDKPHRRECVSACDRYVFRPIATFDRSNDLGGSGEAVGKDSIEVFAGACQRNACSEPNEKRYAKLILNCLDLSAHCARGHVKFPRSELEREMTGGSLEDCQSGQGWEIVIATNHSIRLLCKSSEVAVW